MKKQPDFVDSVDNLFIITTEDRDGLVTLLNEHDVFPGKQSRFPVIYRRFIRALAIQKVISQTQSC